MASKRSKRQREDDSSFFEMILTLHFFLAGHYDTTVQIFDFPKLPNQILQADMM